MRREMSRRRMGKTNMASGSRGNHAAGTPPRPRDRAAGMPHGGGLLGRDKLPEPFVQFGAELASLYFYEHPGQDGQEYRRQVERSEERT